MSKSMAPFMGCLLPIVFAGHASAQSCRTGMEANMQTMTEKAVQCGESADLMSSLQSGSGRISLDELSQSCKNGQSVSSQLSAFNECSRVYVCAVLAYSYASAHLDEFKGDCAEAAKAGLRAFPVTAGP